MRAAKPEHLTLMSHSGKQTPPSCQKGAVDSLEDNWNGTMQVDCLWGFHCSPLTVKEISHGTVFSQGIYMQKW